MSDWKIQKQTVGMQSWVTTAESHRKDSARHFAKRLRKRLGPGFNVRVIGPNFERNQSWRERNERIKSMRS